MTDSILLVVTYGAVAVFLTAVVHRAVKISRLPLHLRWELYPVAHEGRRARYGGSYLEEPDWWTKPREVSLAGELKVMIPEILLLAGVWEHNRPQWLRSFPFHFGLYLLAGLLALLLAGGIAVAAGVAVSPDGGAIGKLLYNATYVVGYVGIGLGLLGSLALLGRRIFNVDYREYTTKGDYFSLSLFVVTFAVALLAHTGGDTYFAGLREYFAQLVTLGGYSAVGEAAGAMPWLTALEIILVSVLLAYIPLTHMSHFFTKWFMYHDVRWSDEPNLVGSKIERQIGEALQYPVSWAAPHIRGDGKKTWAEVATAGVEETEE